MSDFPSLTLEIAFDTTPLSTPTYSDESAYLRRVRNLSRGTQRELQRTEAATGVFELGNATRRFDQTFAPGPHFGKVLPMRRVRLTATWATVPYVIFAGLALAWPQSYPMQRDILTSLSVVDAFRYFSLASVPRTFPAEFTSDRITEVLDALAWLTADRAISAGHILMPQLVATSATNALTVMQDAAAVEAGRLFMARDGKLAFRSQGDSYGSWASAPVFGEIGSELRYGDVQVLFDEVNLENEERVTRVSQGDVDTPVEQVSADLTSQGEFVLRSNPISGFQVATDVDALNYGNYRTARYAEPETRFSTLHVQPARDHSWPTILALDIGDKVTVRRRPSGGAAIDVPSFVEHITHDMKPGGPWTVDIDVSPAARAIAWWQLGDAAYGQLDTTAKVAY